MKLVMIYGPPAVGKLTVAKELAEITDFNVLSHNQLLDVLMPTLELKLSNPKLWEVYEKIKLEIIKMATETNKNLIVTEVYNEKVSLPRIKSYLNSLNKLKVVPYFVRLTAKSEDLIKRVSNKDRLKYNKLKDRKQLKELLDKENLDFDLKFVKGITIDTSENSAEKAAQIIKQHFNLK